jgi:hypothetical protein
MMLISEKWSTGWNILSVSTVYREPYASWFKIKTRPLSREAINVTLARPWSHLWEIGCERGNLKLHISKPNTVTLALVIELYYQRIWLACRWNKYANFVQYISHTLIFQSKSCNVGPETAHFSCNKAFCTSPCRTARHSIIISWWSVSSSGTLAIICKCSFKN